MKLKDKPVSDRRIDQMPHWPDARGWIGIAVVAITVMLLWMMREQALREDEFFQTIATVIISNGFMALVAWAYAATKGGGELADKNADIVKEATKPAEGPVSVTVDNPPSQPVPTSEAATDGELPEEHKL